MRTKLLLLHYFLNITVTSTPCQLHYPFNITNTATSRQLKCRQSIIKVPLKYYHQSHIVPSKMQTKVLLLQYHYQIISCKLKCGVTLSLHYPLNVTTTSTARQVKCGPNLTTTATSCQLKCTLKYY
jgi:hypothetical protein